MPDTEHNIKTLRCHYNTHKAVAAAIGVSFSRYYQWVADTSIIPEYGRELLRLKAEAVSDET